MISMEKKMFDVLRSNMDRWWTWEEIMAKIVRGFVNLSRKSREAEIRKYFKAVARVRELSDLTGYLLMREGIGFQSVFKIANEKKDKHAAIAELAAQHKRIEAGIAREKMRVKNTIERKILPPGTTIYQILKQVDSHPALRAKN